MFPRLQIKHMQQSGLLHLDCMYPTPATCAACSAVRCDMCVFFRSYSLPTPPPPPIDQLAIRQVLLPYSFFFARPIASLSSPDPLHLAVISPCSFPYTREHAQSRHAHSCATHRSRSCKRTLIRLARAIDRWGSGSVQLKSADEKYRRRQFFHKERGGSRSVPKVFGGREQGCREHVSKIGGATFWFAFNNRLLECSWDKWVCCWHGLLPFLLLFSVFLCRKT